MCFCVSVCIHECVCMCISLCERMCVKALLPSRPFPYLLLTPGVGLGKVLEGAGPALGSEKALLTRWSQASLVPSRESTRPLLLVVLPWAPPRARTVAHLCVLFARCQEKPLCLLLLPVSSAPAWGPHPSWGAPAPAPASALPEVSASSTATLPLSFPPLLSFLSPPSSCVEVMSALSVLSLGFRTSSLSRPRQVT